MRGGGRELYIGSSVTPLLQCVPSCCVCWHFMWFGQQLQRDKTKQLPCSVLFARLLLRLLISVNREGSFVCPVGPVPLLLPIHVKLVCGFVRSIDTACQMCFCGSHPKEKVLNWQKVKTPKRIVKNSLWNSLKS